MAPPVTIHNPTLVLHNFDRFAHICVKRGISAPETFEQTIQLWSTNQRMQLTNYGNDQTAAGSNIALLDLLLLQAAVFSL